MSTRLNVVDRDRDDRAFLEDVIEGLSQAPQKAIPARWIYDRRGSELFEAITVLPEYYPTRTEIGLLERHIADIAAAVGVGRVVVEFGSGASTKTPILLQAIAPAAYVPIDISADFLADSARALQARFPALAIRPVVADFTRPPRLPASLAGRPTLGFFPGSTIGNLAAPQAVDLLRAFLATLGEDACLLIGVDRKKPLDILLPAYDDAEGVTAAFNLNLLHRINTELGGNIPVEHFRHEARWNDRHGRVEMHLRADRALRFEVAGHAFAMTAGETIHSENSHKYTPDEARLLLRAGGWETIADWTDAGDLFGLYLARRAGRSIQD